MPLSVFVYIYVCMALYALFFIEFCVRECGFYLHICNKVAKNPLNTVHFHFRNRSGSESCRIICNIWLACSLFSIRFQFCFFYRLGNKVNMIGKRHSIGFGEHTQSKAFQAGALNTNTNIMHLFGSMNFQTIFKSGLCNWMELMVYILEYITLQSITWGENSSMK